MSAYRERILNLRAQFHLGGIAPTSKDARKVADYILKGWGNEYYLHDYGQIKMETGNPKDTMLGKLYKHGGGKIHEKGAPLSDDEFQRTNRIVLSLSPAMYQFVHSHYFDRMGRSVKEFLESGEAMTESRFNYYKLLRAAQQEAIARGILG